MNFEQTTGSSLTTFANGRWESSLL